MTDFLFHLFKMSFLSGYMLLFVLLLRFIFKSMPKSVSVMLLELVGLRLICPFTLKTIFSLIPEDNKVLGILEKSNPSINPNDYFLGFDSAIAHKISELIFIIWALGAALMLIYMAASYLRTYMSVRKAKWENKNIYLSSDILAPFSLGLIFPRIYIPSDMSWNDFNYVLLHEKAHIRRGDPFFKVLGFLILSLHWFNPLVWLSYILLCRDIELACDEKVIKNLSVKERADYSQALLNCSIKSSKKRLSATAFGEIAVKDRIKAIIKYKKSSLLIKTLSVVSCVLLALCFLTDPLEAKADNRISSLLGDNIVSTDGENIVREYYEEVRPNLSIEIKIKDGEKLKRIYVAKISDGSHISLISDIEDSSQYFQYKDGGKTIIVDLISFFKENNEYDFNVDNPMKVAVRIETEKVNG